MSNGQICLESKIQNWNVNSLIKLFCLIKHVSAIKTNFRLGLYKLSIFKKFHNTASEGFQGQISEKFECTMHI